jgi:competence ComEA-like helix-hairpin-helix protein
LSFTGKERIGILTIVLLIVLIWIFPQVIKSSNSQISLGDTSWITEINSLQHMENDSGSASAAHDESLNDHRNDQRVKKGLSEAEQKLFYFDPNTLSAEGWKKLGVREKTINIIHNYLSKGGHFEKPDDLKKIYGIHPDEFAGLTRYIQIERKNESRFTGNSNPQFDKRSSQVENVKHDLVEINTADTVAFIALPGIGSKLAIRIINFRDKLGGFYSIDQVGETYGLADSTFQKIRPWLKLKNVSLIKIDINTATKEEMKSHPYLRWGLANAIVEYRNQHGKYSAVEDLKKVSAITQEIFEKIKPYISVE